MSASLDLNIIDTHNRKTIAIGDNSVYNTSSPIVSPSLSITIPGFGENVVVFTPKSLNIYNSNTLNITDGVSEEELVILPDGIWKVSYTINPAYENHTEISFLKTDLFEEKLAGAFLSLELSECDDSLLSQGRKDIDDIELYLSSAKSAAKICDYNLSLQLYKMAEKKLDKFIKTGCYGLSNCKV